MSMTIDPDKSPVTAGGKAKKKAPGMASGSSDTPQTFDMTGGNGDPSRAGVVIRGEDNKGIAAILDVSNSKRMYNGDPALLSLLDRYVDFITGEKSFGGAGPGARFGVIGIFARRLPPPVLFDAPDLVDLLGDTMCVDTVGRIFVYAPFFVERLKEEQQKLLSVTPCLTHEYLHNFLEHTERMRMYDSLIANIAQDRVINPMTVQLWAAGAKFSPFFLNAWGNKKDDAKYRNLSEETIAKMMLSEMAAKGSIKIKTLTIVDGPVGAITTHTAEHGDVLDLGDVTVTVEDMGMTDKLDTVFDCGILTVEKVDNQLKPRNRPGLPGGNPLAGTPEDRPIKIPVINPNNIVEGMGEQFGGGGSHTIDEKTLKDGLKKRGYGHVTDDLKIGETPENSMQTHREAAMNEASRERNRIGNAYPGSHVESHYGEVVKPSREYSITWERRIQEFISGTGPVMSRSIDEPGILNFVDAEDMDMTEDDRCYMAGLLPQKPEDVYVFINDTSGSVDRERLSRYISIGIAMRNSVDDMAPEVIIVGADTVIRGNPQELDDDTLADIAENGYEFHGRGGTDIIAPLNQIMKWAKDTDRKIAGIVYATDLGIYDVDIDKLPEDLPPLMFVAIPEDYANCQQFVQSVKEFAEVVVIEKDMELNFEAAEEKSHVRGRGIGLS